MENLQQTAFSQTEKLKDLLNTVQTLSTENKKFERLVSHLEHEVKKHNQLSYNNFIQTFRTIFKRVLTAD